MTDQAPKRRSYAASITTGLAIVMVLTVVAQATFAGGSLTGRPELRTIHRELVFSVIIWVAFAALVASILAWRLDRRPGWAPLVATAATIALVVQIYAGFQRLLMIHLPLGVTIGLLYMLLAVAMRSRRPDPDIEQR